MVGIKPTDVAPSAAIKVIGAGTAACIADLITFPLDTAKVRLQVGPPPPAGARSLTRQGMKENR